MEDIDISCYLRPAGERKPEDIPDEIRHPQHPRTYSVVFGYGFRPKIKPRAAKGLDTKPN